MTAKDDLAIPSTYIEDLDAQQRPVPLPGKGCPW